jgi:hypothetical protein
MTVSASLMLLLGLQMIGQEDPGIGGWHPQSSSPTRSTPRSANAFWIAAISSSSAAARSSASPWKARSSSWK